MSLWFPEVREANFAASSDFRKRNLSRASVSGNRYAELRQLRSLRTTVEARRRAFAPKADVTSSQQCRRTRQWLRQPMESKSCNRLVKEKPITPRPPLDIVSDDPTASEAVGESKWLSAASSGLPRGLAASLRALARARHPRVCTLNLIMTTPRTARGCSSRHRPKLNVSAD